jgi:predicted molibdopterin-dependent oxidoreductase YjgC
VISGPEKNLVVIYNIDSLWEKSKNDLKAIGNLMMMTGRVGKAGNGIVILRDFANSQGLLDMGLDTKYLPGHIGLNDAAGIKKMGTQWKTKLADIFRPVDLPAVMEAEKIKALLIFGEDPINGPSNLRLTGGADFMVVVDHFMTATALEADVVLPASLPIETDGSFTACDRRVQAIRKVFEPKAGMENWRIINDLAGKMGLGVTFGSAADISKEIKKVIPFYKDLAEGGFWGKDFLAGQFLTAGGKGRFAPVPVELYPCNVEKIPYLFTENYFNVQIRGKLSE